MYKPQSLFILILILSICACVDDMVIVQQEPETETEPDQVIDPDTCSTFGPFAIDGCPGDIIYRDLCESITNADTTKYCGPFFIGEFFLSDKSREICKRLCMRAEDEYHYVNSAGAMLSYKAEYRQYSFGQTVSYTNMPCQDEPSKFQKLCYHRDYFSVYYEPINSGLPFLIRMSPKPTPFLWQVPELHYDVLEILEFPAPSSSHGKLRIVTDTLCSPITEILSTVRYNTLVLNNQTYSNVYTRLPTPFLESQYYFNLTQGIIGFETEDGELYTLME